MNEKRRQRLLAIVDKHVREAQETGRSLDEAAQNAADEFDEEVKREEKEKRKKAYQRRKAMKNETPFEKLLRKSNEAEDRFVSRVFERAGVGYFTYDPLVEEIAEAIRIVRATNSTLERYWEIEKRTKEVFERGKWTTNEE